MKKTIATAIIGMTIGAVGSPMIGMAINPTRDLILGMAPEEAVTKLADEIDGQKVQVEEQGQKIENLEEKQAQEAINSEKELTEKERQECLRKLTANREELEADKKSLAESIGGLDEKDQKKDCLRKGMDEDTCNKFWTDTINNNKDDAKQIQTRMNKLMERIAEDEKICG